jgi:hypothetical protein
MTAALVAVCAAFLRRHSTPGLVELLLLQHAVDGTGHCCTCRSGSDGSGRLVGPCVLRQAAILALLA